MGQCSSSDQTQKLKLWQNSQSQIVTKLKNLNHDSNQKLKVWQNSNCAKTEKLKLWQTSKTQIFTTQSPKLGQNSNYEEEKKTQILTTKKLKLWQKSRTQIVTKLKTWNCDKTQIMTNLNLWEEKKTVKESDSMNDLTPWQPVRYTLSSIFQSCDILLDPIGSQYIRAISATLNLYFCPHVENPI